MSPEGLVIIPRWEWRSFAPELAERRQSLAHRLEEQGAPRQETYLLCGRSSANAKIREGRLQVKWRKEVAEDGLELWDPLLEAAFPLVEASIERLFGIWSLAEATPPVAATDVAAFVRYLSRSAPAITVVAVHKRHERFQEGGVPCCFTALDVAGRHVLSFSAEHEDPSLVMQVVRSLGLDGLENTNTPRGLKQLLGIPSIHSQEKTWARKSNASTS